MHRQTCSVSVATKGHLNNVGIRRGQLVTSNLDLRRMCLVAHPTHLHRSINPTLTLDVGSGRRKAASVIIGDLTFSIWSATLLDFTSSPPFGFNVSNSFGKSYPSQTWPHHFLNTRVSPQQSSQAVGSPLLKCTTLAPEVLAMWLQTQAASGRLRQ